MPLVAAFDQLGVKDGADIYAGTLELHGENKTKALLQSGMWVHHDRCKKCTFLANTLQFNLNRPFENEMN